MSEFPRIVLETVRTGIARFDAQAFPFLSRRSVDAAEAAECAADQEAYWQYRERLYDPENGLRSGADLIDAASGLGLDVQAFRRCVENDTYASEVEAQIQGGQERGVTGTPTVLVGDRRVSWGADSVIAAARQAAQGRPTSIRGRIFGSQGALPGVYVTVGEGLSARTQADGSFSITVPFGGGYVLEANLDGCRIYYNRSRGAVGSANDATTIQVSGTDSSEIRIEIPPGVCARQIRGRLVGSDGAGLSSVWVEADGETREFAEARSEADGSFAVRVPVSGQYRLSVWRGCWVFYVEGDGVTTSLE